MAYINFKPTVKAVNLKSDGDIEIKILVPGHEMRGRIEMLHEMIGEKVEAEFASTVVSYNVQINARTSKPVTQYRVDDTGVVHEVKPEGEQVEMELGFPPEKLKIEDKPNSIELQIIVDFILESLAPEYEDLLYDFHIIHDRLSKGETYSRIATDLGISSGKLAEMVEEYRRRVAPLAAKWNEWREGNEPSTSLITEPSTEPEQVEANPDQEAVSEDQPENAAGTMNLQDELPDWMQQSMQDEQSEQSNSQSNDNVIPDAADIKLSEIDREELEQFILTHKPMYPDIEFNYPDLLEKRHTGKSWLDIAKELQVNSSKLKNSWVLYKKRAARQMIDTNGAA